MSDAGTTPTVGHNSNLTKPERKALSGYVKEIELFEEEKRVAATHISEIYKDAKEHGLNVKAIRAIIRMRKQDADARAELEAVIETYMHALGQLADLPLGQAAVKAATKPPKATLPTPDVSEQPFAPPADDEPRAAQPD